MLSSEFAVLSELQRRSHQFFPRPLVKLNCLDMSHRWSETIAAHAACVFIMADSA